VTLPPDSMGQRSVEGFLWSGSAVGAQAFGQIAVLALLARFLTAVEFGVVSAALVVIGLVRILTEAIVGPAVTQRPDLTVDHQKSAFALSLYIGLAAGVIMFVSAEGIASLFAIPELVPVVRALAPMFLLESLGTVPAALLQRDLAFSRLSIVEMISFLVGYSAVGVILALLGAGIWALVAAQLGFSVVKSGMLLVRRPHPKGLLLSRRASREILYFGGGHMSARFLNYLAIQGDYFVVGRWMSAESLGFYGRAYQLALRPSVLLGIALDRVIFPVMATVQGDLERLRRVYRRSVSLVASLTAPLSALGVILGSELVLLVLGPGWEEVNVPFKVFAAGLLFRTGYKPSDSLAKATGIVYQRARRQAVYAIIVFPLALVGTRWGLPGVSYGVLAAIVINYLMMAQLSVRQIEMTWKDFATAHLRGFATAVMAAAVVLPTSALMRSVGAGSFQVLFGSLGTLVVLVGPAVVLWPRAVLGPDVLWFRDRVKSRAGRRTSPKSP